MVMLTPSAHPTPTTAARTTPTHHTHCSMFRLDKGTAPDKCKFRPCCLDTRTDKTRIMRARLDAVREFYSLGVRSDM
jgi:hypothetical protein